MVVQKQSRNIPSKFTSIIFYLMLTALAFAYLVPLFWVLSVSLRTSGNLFAAGQFIPNPVTLDHYRKLFDFLPDIWRYAFNTLRIAILATIGQVLSCSLAGYALARLQFPGRGVILVLLLLTLMVPGQVTIIPIYVLFRELQWINTPWAIVVPAFFGNAFATFFFRQFFMNIPREVEEAALLDGAGRFRIFWNIAAPMAKPAFLALGALTFVGQWNGFFAPTIFLQTQDQWVLTQGLDSLLGRYQSQWGEIMAGVVLMSLPIIIVYAFIQRYLIEGVTFTGIKG
ncbi:MAG: carbohydrate ABC transporter permease [Chloroflexota bacterium]|nr:carbohydrate ABC transporter permease [Chloroflexota bacterium]